MKAFLRRHFIGPIIGMLSQGITPRQIALSLAFGIGLGIFPILGTTTVLCTAAALAWRLNMVAIYTVHFAIMPAQLLLIIPFVRAGERIVQVPPQPLSMDAGMELIAASGRRNPRLTRTYGADQTRKWWVYWRVFFMARAEAWGFRGGHEWLVSKYLLQKP